MSEEIRYDAFISYRHCNPDKEIAIKLHKALENFRLPHSVSKKIGKRKLERVFRDEAELAVSAELSEEIEKALLHSEYLILNKLPHLFTTFTRTAIFFCVQRTAIYLFKI